MRETGFLILDGGDLVVLGLALKIYQKIVSITVALRSIIYIYILPVDIRGSNKKYTAAPTATRPVEYFKNLG